MSEKKSSIWIKLIGAFFGLSLLGGFLLAGLLFYFYLDLPKVRGLQDFNPPIPSKILSKDGEVLLETGLEKREIAKINEIPRKVINAFLAAEDDNFYAHHGVDPLGIMRAMLVNIKAGRIVQGGSTITQQVAKALYLTRERSIVRKIKDFLLAIQLEKKFTKDEILFLYLNEVYLGGGYYGIKAAFRGYFDKDLIEASPAESAMIAGLLVAPGRYSPYINPKYAKTRQRYVLKRMYETNKINKEEYENALKEPLKLRIKKPSKLKGGHFTDWVRQRVVRKFGKENFLRNGFRVVTTIDYELQKVAEEEIEKGVKKIDKRQGYKGPLQKLADKESIDAFVESYRKEIYKENSNYFFLLPDSSRKYEIAYRDDEMDEVKAYDQAYMESRNSRYLFPDNSEIQDKSFDEFIVKNENYKAVVTGVSDSQRMIYVSIGGVKGIIPYEQFRWAHERVIDENKNLFPYVTKPSSIVSTGDVLNVKVLKKDVTLYFYLWKGFQKRIKDKDIAKTFKKQKFHLLLLDQEADVEGALVAMDPDSGRIISFVGGKDFSKSQFNRAIQSLRQPGSSFKPILFAAALEKGFKPNHVLIDSPEALGGVDEGLNWKPRNYDGKFKGEMTLRASLEQSRNVPTIKLAQEVSVPYILDFVKRLGLDAELAPDLSLSLGSFGVTLVDMVQTYSVFANGGRKVTPYSIISIEDRFGKQYDVTEVERLEDSEEGEEAQEVNEESIPEEIANIDNPESAEKKEGEEEEEINPYLVDLTDNQVYDKRLAYIMTNLLRGVVHNGTGRSVKSISSFIGGKTGTTNNYVDAWFLGFAPNLALGVWTGFDDNKTLGWGETGGKSALPIWGGYMKSFLNKFGETDFKVPGGIINVLINKDDGRIATAGDTNTILESFVKGTEPGTEEEIQVSSDEEEQDKVIVDDDDYYSNQ